MIHLSALLCLCSLVHGSFKIKSVEKQEATVGSSVTLQCQLVATQPNIFQITWQKESGNFTGPVATYSKKYGSKMIGYFSQRTEQHTVDTLDVSAITIYPVALEDQGCFTCIFNIYPFGANAERTCLDVFETNILEPRLEIHHTNSSYTSDELYIVTCSATGYPAPNITWKLPDSLEITPETYITVQPNRTVTVVSNFTQRAPRTVINVICVVHHPALNAEKYLSDFIKDPGEEDSSSSSSSSLAGSVICSIVSCSIIVPAVIVIVVVFVIKRKIQYSNIKKEHSTTSSITTTIDMNYEFVKLYPELELELVVKPQP